ncbi:hypothetical protein QJQ45_009889 [Haematococcus lacustris]|nr:hypothetical protein QJQ45_009889 [Haematococcus lacustris]
MACNAELCCSATSKAKQSNGGAVLKYGPLEVPFGALNIQRIGESKWCPLELCYWAEQGKLPAKGKEYPGLGYKRLRDKPPKTQSAVAQHCVPPPILSCSQLTLSAVLLACRKVLGRPSRPKKPNRLPGKVVLVEEHRTSQTEQAAELTQAIKATGKGQGKAARATPAPQPGRWVGRDCNAVLKVQGIEESKWRPLELCWWPGHLKLPPSKGKYPGLGYDRLT